jgi:hypothetical protein
MARSPIRGFAFLVACGLAGLGCKQNVGGRCVQDSDCESGICSVYGESANAGRCESATSPTPPSDASTDTAAGGQGGQGGQSGQGGQGGQSGQGGGSDGAVDRAADASNADARASDALPVVDAMSRDVGRPDVPVDRAADH